MTNLSIHIDRAGEIRIEVADAAALTPLHAAVGEALTTDPALPRYVYYTAAGDAVLETEDYDIVLDRVAGLYIDVRGEHTGNWDSCANYAQASDLLDRSWRLPTVDEAFNHIADRTRHSPAAKPPFAKLGNRWLWTCTPDASEKDSKSPVGAWGVDIGCGLAVFSLRSIDGLALPVSPVLPGAGQ